MERVAVFKWLDFKEGTLSGYLNALLPELNGATDAFITSWKKTRFVKNSQVLQEDIDIHKALLLGGKKLRAALVVLGYENFQPNHSSPKEILTAAISYELLHNSFLIHDDIEDNSNLRRGQPTVHEQYTAKHISDGGLLDHRQYGVSLALNIGSLGAVRALDVLWQTSFEDKHLAKAQRWLTWVLSTTLQGQRRDLTEVHLDQLKQKDIYEIYHQKTAVYTVVGPLTLGAILAGASDRQLGYLNAFGVNLGIAFQLIDDHLGLYGTEEILGKPIGSDLSEAKKTLHFVKAYQIANSVQRDFLQSVWGKSGTLPAKLDYTRQLLDKLGVKNFVLEKANQLASKAFRLIPKVSMYQEVAVILEDLTNFVVKRQV